MIPHFTRQAPITTEMYEPLYKNLFEVHFSFPKLVGLSQKDSDIMMMSANKVDLDLTPKLDVATQAFKYSQRLYARTPSKTALESFTIDFAMNVNDKNSILTWNYMKNWYDLGWNSQTGELHYKRDMVGGIVAHIHDRAGIVVRRVEFINVMCLGVQAMNFAWSESDILSGQATFACDYWIDQYWNVTAKR